MATEDAADHYDQVIHDQDSIAAQNNKGRGEGIGLRDEAFAPLFLM